MIITEFQMLENLEKFMNQQPVVVKQTDKFMAGEIVMSETYEIKPVTPVIDGYREVKIHPGTDMVIAHFNNDKSRKQVPEFVFADSGKGVASKLDHITRILRGMAEKSN